MDAAVTILIGPVEDHPVLVELTEVLEEDAVLADGHVVVTVFSLAGGVGPGSLVSSHHDWLRVEDLREHNAIAHSFVDLGKGQVAITVEVHAIPLVDSHLLLLIVLFMRQLLCKVSPEFFLVRILECSSLRISLGKGRVLGLEVHGLRNDGDECRQIQVLHLIN